jgi:hypothetical protein
MARHYSTRDFFRQIPNALLARYFGARDYFADLDFAAMKESKPDPLFARWLELPDPERTKMEAELCAIHGLCDEKGWRAILDEAEFHFTGNPDGLRAFVTTLAGCANHYERAMLTFLEHPQFWRGATRFHHADSLTYWRKRKNLPSVPAAVDQASLNGLAAVIGNYFHVADGRGKNCHVECLRRGERDYFFCYPEDFSQEGVEWVNGEFDRRPHNPAFEVIYVYSQAERTLDLHVRGTNKSVEALQYMFATSILRQSDLPPDPKDSRVYDLNPIGQRTFEFMHAPGSGIESVAVRSLRLSSKAKKGDRITVEADTGSGPLAVYDLLAKIGPSLPLSAYHVTRVEFVARVIPDNDTEPKSVTVSISHPNHCSLKYDDVDLKLRDMLCASGIEPHEPDVEGARESA